MSSSQDDSVHKIAKLFMASQHQTPKEYKWTNRKDYGNNTPVQQSGDKTLKTEDQSDESQKVRALFDIVNSRSEVAIAHFNDKEQTMTLYDCSVNTWKRWRTTDTSAIIKRISNIRNYFNYQLLVNSRAGCRGYQAGIEAQKQVKFGTIKGGYHKSIWSRVDKDFSCNSDMMSLDYQIKRKTWLYDQLQLKLNRVSRQNEINPYKKGDVVNYGIKPEQLKRITHSNITTIGASIRKGFVVLMGKAGYDIANKSLYGKLGFTFYYMKEGPWNTMFYGMLEGAQIWGRNVLKNDHFHRNRTIWPGDKCTNFISPRVECHFANYPGLNILKFVPYLYLQGWAHYRPSTELGQGKVVCEGDYGLGLSRGTNWKMDLSLLNFSVQRERGGWGAIKFSFF